MSDNRTLAQRFWPRVRKTETCWLWDGSTSRGYGYLSVDGRMRIAHHVSYFLTHRRWPESEVLMQACGCRTCVRPDHLFPGTYKHQQWMWRFRRRPRALPAER